MAGKTWEKVLIWKLEGVRFDEHQGVDLRDLEALVYLRGALVDIAKVLWKQRHQKKKIPHNIERDVDLRVRSFEDGCVQSSIYIGIPAPSTSKKPQLEFFGEEEDDLRMSFFRTFHDAAAALEQFVAAVRDDLPTADIIPTDTIPDVEKMVRGFRTDERVSIEAVRSRIPRQPEVARAEPREPTETYVARQQAARSQPPRQPVSPTEVIATAPPLSPPPPPPPPPAITVEVRQKLAALRSRVEHDQAKQRSVVVKTVAGEVTMASLAGKASLSVDDGDEIAVDFLPEDETKVTLALYAHQRLRLRIRGNADVDSKGRFKKIAATKVVIVEPPDPAAHSEALFERLATEDPEKLIELIESGSVRPTMLTYVAEIAGSRLPMQRVVPVLLKLLQHEAPIVREGALYGLREHQWKDDSIRRTIAGLSVSDPSPGVKTAAIRVLNTPSDDSDPEAEPDPEGQSSSSAPDGLIDAIHGFVGAIRSTPEEEQQQQRDNTESKKPNEGNGDHE